MGPKSCSVKEFLQGESPKGSSPKRAHKKGYTKEGPNGGLPMFLSKALSPKLGSISEFPRGARDAKYHIWGPKNAAPKSGTAKVGL